MGTDRPADRTLWPGRWFRLEVGLPFDREDDAIGLCASFGSDGASSRPAGPRRVMLDAWFGDENAARQAADVLGGWPGAALKGPPEPVEDTGWLAASLAPRAPLAVGRFVVVERDEDARQARSAGRFAIVLPAGRAFGTGEHATTRMCLSLLDRYMAPGAAVFDVGTGSAILAIGAHFAGASRVLAVDNDAAVVEVAADNVALNGAAGKIEIREGSWDAPAEGETFDLVLANIHRTALQRAAHPLAARLRPGAHAILSGFHGEDAGPVREKWTRAGCRVVDESNEGEWTALAVTRD